MHVSIESIPVLFFNGKNSSFLEVSKKIAFLANGIKSKTKVSNFRTETFSSQFSQLLKLGSVISFSAM